MIHGTYYHIEDPEAAQTTRKAECSYEGKYMDMVISLIRITKFTLSVISANSKI